MEKQENRFKLARTIHNQHGKESVKSVFEKTGISKSLIDDLESNVGKKRAVSYLTVKELAEYYGVTSDYLLGLSDNPSRDEDIQIAAKTTGLSNTAIIQLERISTVYRGKQAVDAFISSPCFYQAASYLSTYFFGTWLEEFTGKDEGLISTLKPLKDHNLYERYIQPAMLAKITECLIETKKQLDIKSNK